MEMNSMRLLILVLLTAVLAGPPEAESCGPFLSFAQFTYVAQPPQDVFARGQLGILRPKYYRRYLVVAYRYLTGVPLNREEIAEFSGELPAVPASSAPVDPVDQWLKLRNQVPGVTPVQSIGRDRPLQAPNAFESYRNCLDDAFGNAAQTLRERTVRWGLNSPQLAEWARGQDAVFRNCNGGDETPPPLPAAADPILAADRRYQIAAAEFYSEQYEDAEKDFASIANDVNSPWRDLGRFLVARTLIREGTVREDESKLQEAEQSLDSVIADSQQAKWRGSAQKLRDLVEARLHPEGQMRELGNRLVRPGGGSEFAHALDDFTDLWDRHADAAPRDSELADWIMTLQAQRWDHAVERWRERRNNAWLVAALSSVPHDNPAVPDLLAAAQGVRVGTPAWPSAAYYGITLELARGEKEAARKWTDQAIATNPSADVRNEFVAQRMTLARNWQEFLRDGPRTPVAMVYLDSDEPLDEKHRERVFDNDFTIPFNLEVPLDRWVDGASNKLLPTGLQAGIAQAAWTRAVVLDRIPQAQALAPRLAELRPELRIPLQSWQNEKDPKAAKFQAILLMLRTPGLQPVIRDRFGRETPNTNIDNFRDNWWDLSEPGSLPESTPQFLPQAERAAGRQEWQQLQATALRAPDYLCAETVAWARAHPDDSRVPEALHLAVRTTRYTNHAHTTSFPKQAFQLLHSRYPKSEWTVLTPYWY
jgi:hypothetical protein